MAAHATSLLVVLTFLSYYVDPLDGAPWTKGLLSPKVPFSGGRRFGQPAG